jgi:hypothetical protein
MPRVAALAATLLFLSLPRAAVVAQGPNTSRAATPSAAIRPGTYDLEVEYGGGVLQGTLVLAASGDSLTATLHVGEHEPPVRRLTRNGAHLVVTAGAEGMDVIYQLDFNGDTVKGVYTFNGAPGSVTGKRRT